ncbi:MAG: hypothetical protein M1828_001794 [Chrysothrix sp. TS-e1954]|nr:MAG: hypothetical protein M1828_001794 [Chrysothrix sp. TS-e1954]
MSHASNPGIPLTNPAAPVSRAAALPVPPMDQTSNPGSAVRSDAAVNTNSQIEKRQMISQSTAEKEKSTSSVTAVPQRQRRRKLQPCKFYGSKKGCRAGDQCPYLHESATKQQAGDATNRNPNTITNAQTTDHKASTQDTQIHQTAPIDDKQRIPEQVRDAARQVQAPRITKDPRSFQISQIRTRFSAKEEKSHDGVTTLQFRMPPSDPDFPFEIESLDCILRLPIYFPQYHKPSLRVKNPEMERGYQINVENGFDAIWSQASQPTLLNAMKLLDRRLEALLVAQKAEIVKIIANNTRPANAVRAAPDEQASQQGSDPKPAAIPPVASPKSGPSAAEVDEASAKRLAETQTLEHRFGRSPGFAKLAEGTIYSVPIDPRKRGELPTRLQAIKTLRLFVPLSYGIDPCTIELADVEDDAKARIENAFSKRASEHLEMSLMAHVNNVVQNMHSMAKYTTSNPTQAKPLVEPQLLQAKDGGHESEKKESKDSHIQYIPRPPEWAQTVGEQSADSSDSDDYDGADDSEPASHDEDEVHEPDGDQASNAASSAREAGTMLSFPDLQLFGIELLELTNVNLTIKCDRCKETQDVHNLRSTSKTSSASSTNPSNHPSISTSCRKCAHALTVAFRPDLIHAASSRAGYLDLDACTPVDLLASSSFTPTCASCSTSMASGMNAHRGATDHSIAICRHCHQRMSLSMPSVKFLRIGPSTRLPDLPLRRKQPKENLGIVAGTPLPSTGRCPHYRKSNRWFRFSCCQKVFPCDKCHDAAPETHGHVMEFANRMICGFCSREQNYRPESCGFCGQGLVGKRGTGFWEGGKGTRDPKRMSRKDPRKYKRRPKKL